MGKRDRRGGAGYPKKKRATLPSVDEEQSGPGVASSDDEAPKQRKGMKRGRGAKAEREEDEEEASLPPSDDEEDAEGGEVGLSHEEDDDGDSDDDDSADDDEDDSDEDDIRMDGAVGQLDESSSSEEDDDEEEEEQRGGKKRKGEGKGEEGSEVNVIFEFSDPKEDFFFGIRALLQWLADEGVDGTGLAELVVQEKGLGSVVHAEGETDAFGVAACLNLKAHKALPAMKQLHTLLLERCPASLKGAMQAALKEDSSYVLIHGRFVNMPLAVVARLHESLREDAMWAQQQDPQLPRVKKVVVIAPCQADLKAGESYAYVPSDTFYDRFEDEVFVQNAELSFCSRGSGAAASKKGEKGASKGAANVKKALVVSVMTDDGWAQSLVEVDKLTSS